MNNGLNAYKDQQEANLEQSILKSSPNELVLMLYEALLKNLLIVKYSEEGKVGKFRIEKMGNALVKSQDILISLKNNLDFNYEASENLSEIYLYMIGVLKEMNITKATESLDDMIYLATELRDTWKEITTL